MRSKTIFVDDFRQLTLQVFTLGYPSEGEAEVVLLLDGKKPVVTIVTDCYYDKGNDFHAIDEVLNMYGNPSIDAFVWSHPHRDHSVGIVELLDKFDSRRTAIVIIPDGIMSMKGVSLVDDTMKYLNDNYFSKDLLYVVGVTNQERRTVAKWELYQQRIPTKMPLRLEVLSPMTAKETERIFNLKTVSKNCVNIFYTLNINSQNYLFCGDLCSNMVEYINEECLYNVPYLKIPHHASNEPLNFYKKLEKIHLLNGVGLINVAVTTVKASSDLPNPKVIKEYKKICENVYSTHYGKSPIGAVKCSYQIQPFGFSSFRIGNAKRM